LLQINKSVKDTVLRNLECNTEIPREKIKNDQLPVYRSYTLTHKDQIVKELLLCASRLSSYSKLEFVNKYGFDYLKLIPEELHQLKNAGLIGDYNEDLLLTRKGIIYGDFVGKILAMAVKQKLGDDVFEFIY